MKKALLKKALLLTTLALYHYAAGKRINGPCSRLYGKCSRLSGDFDDCEISDEDREDGVYLCDLIAVYNADLANLADVNRVEPVEEEAAK